MTLTMRYAARSDRGLIRDGNQDSVYAGPRLLAVADGMGGMAAGDVASNIVIGAMAPLDEDVPGNALVDALRHAVDTANQQIRDAVEANPEMEGMGTTLTAMLFGGSKIGMVHIGDSRAYLLRDGEFAPDHPGRHIRPDAGRRGPDHRRGGEHPPAAVAADAGPGRPRRRPRVLGAPGVAGDRYLICSDGLSGVVSDETIAATMREYADPNQCAERLIQLALRGGGPDNITVIVADVTDAGHRRGGAGRRRRGRERPGHGELGRRVDPAARASALTGRRRAGTRPTPRRRRGRRTARSGTRSAPRSCWSCCPALLGGGLWVGWRYTQSQYYVGVTDDGTVAVFQGIPGQIAGLDLSTVNYEQPGTSLDDLTPVAQEQGRQGIQADSEPRPSASWPS